MTNSPPTQTPTEPEPLTGDGAPRKIDARLRRIAKRLHLSVHKSRARNDRDVSWQQYQILTHRDGLSLKGGDGWMSQEDALNWLENLAADGFRA